MNAIDLLYQYLEDNNFKKNPYKIKRCGTNIISIGHRNPVYSLEFYKEGDNINSRIVGHFDYEYEDSFAGSPVENKITLNLDISGDRFHGNVSDPKIFDKIQKSILKFHSTESSDWTGIYNQRLKPFKRIYRMP